MTARGKRAWRHVTTMLARMGVLSKADATGARVSEALGLDWRDVDLVHKRVVLRNTKNGKDRLVDLCPRAVTALESVTGPKRRRQPPEPVIRVGEVFRSHVGKPYEVESKAEQGGGQAGHFVCPQAILREIDPSRTASAYMTTMDRRRDVPNLVLNSSAWLAGT
jgi:integrase